MSSDQTLCTFIQTGNKYRLQKFYRCKKEDCIGDNPGTVFCENCLKCHEGHDYEVHGTVTGFCDCYETEHCIGKYKNPNPDCSYNGKREFIYQEWAVCYDCFDNENEGACV